MTLMICGHSIGSTKHRN